MEDFNSKYTGQQVEDLLDQVASGNTGGGSGGITIETDPIFTASPAASITDAKITEWDSKSAQGEKGDKGDDGVGIASVVQTTTSSADGGSNIVTVTLTDGTTSTFSVKNGSKGSQGIQGEKGDKGDKGDTGATGAAGKDGTDGAKGDKGDTGANGVSVSSVKQTTTSNADGGTNVVTVTLSNGTTSTFNVKNGSKGSNGSNGTNGSNGATFTPSVDSNGNLSWTNDKGLANPATVNIKGPKGDSGSGGGGSGESYAGNYPIVRQQNLTLTPNTFTIYNYSFSGQSTFSFGAPANTSIANEYIVAFYIRASSAGVTLPASVVWGNDDVPALEAGYTYIFSVVDNVALYTKAKGNIYNIQTAGGGDN